MRACFHVVGLALPFTTPQTLFPDMGPDASRWKQEGSYSSSKGPWVSYPTDKALGVPQGVQGRDVVFQDSPGTASTLGSKHIKVVLAAIGFAILLVKSCQRRGEAKGSAPHLHLWPHSLCRVIPVGRIILPPANTHSSYSCSLFCSLPILAETCSSSPGRSHDYWHYSSPINSSLGTPVVPL